MMEAPDYGDDAPGVNEDSGALRKFQDLLAELAKMPEEIKALEADLSEAKGRKKHLQQDELPNVMLRELRTRLWAPADGGYEVVCEPFAEGSIAEDRREAAMDMLVAKGHGDIVKRQVVLEFGKGEETLAEAVIELLRESAVRVEDEDVHVADRIEVKRTVHYQTLNSHLRDLLAQQRLDEEMRAMFKVWIGDKVVVRKSKKRKR